MQPSFYSYGHGLLLAGLIWLAGGGGGRGGTVYQSPLAGRNKIDWFVANFKDHGDGITPRDYRGGFQTYVGHGGMDLWPYDYQAMDAGIEVRAAAAGTVLVVRDRIYEMWPGVNYLFPSPYILIRHADGSRGYYYHIRHGSAAVAEGQAVTNGQKLALMGPHLHFEVQNAAGVSQEIMTNQAGQVQNFDWFDSYSNQVLRQVLGMGVTKTNDVLLGQDLFEQTPRAYTRIRSGPFTPWIKYVGLPAGERLTIRLLAEAGPGGTLDLTDWPMQAGVNLKWWYCYWYVWSLVDGTTYRLQYRWNDGAWTDAPGNPVVVADDAAEEEYVSRYSPHYTRYVAATNRTPEAPYTSWATAATTIQDAIAASQDGDLVIVGDGIYDAGGVSVQGAPTRVAVTKAMAVRSANGPHVTFIRGAGAAGSAAARCAYVTNGAFLAGFTLTGGTAGDRDGGGAYGEPYAGIVNCIVSGCAASNGAGIYGGLVANCLVYGNAAAGRGGGTYRSEVSYSTLADNTAAGGGGGSWGGCLFSSIAWFNTAGGQTANFEFEPGSWVWYSCVTPAAAGYMNITNEPMFVDRVAADYRLGAGSPGIDCGAGGASWGLDIDHGARIVNFVPDMGAFEYSPLPAAPWGVAAARKPRRVRLSWDAAPRAAGYRIWRGTRNYSSMASLLGATATNFFDDRQTVPGTNYYYWVQATNAAGTGALSAAACGNCRNWNPGLLRCDFDGDGANEVAVIDTINGGWYAVSLSNVITLWQPCGGPVGATPVAGDYDGDGMADPAVWEAASGKWQVKLSANGYRAATLAGFGGPGCRPAPLDFDGDGKDDPAIFEMAGGKWQVLLSGSGYALATADLGGAGWAAAAGDYDGDGKADPAVFEANPSTGSTSSLQAGFPLRQDATAGQAGQGGRWQALLSANGYASAGATFGGSDCLPVPLDYDGDGKTDPGVYEEATGAWQALLSSMGYSQASAGLGGVGGCTPVPGDYDGDGKADLCLYQESTGLWLLWLSGSGYAPAGGYFGGTGFSAVGAAP
jgi:hypothetical protein